MCNIAGYTGQRQAAPILIDMLRRQEYLDGGLSTGIATIHEGVLYHAKVVGSVDDLIEKTDALNFPGTTGIIHSRPDNNYVEYAHPFVCENEKGALVANGNSCNDEFLVTIRNSIAEFLHRNNANFTSAMNFEKSSYPQLKDGRYVAYGEAAAKAIEYSKKISSMSYEEIMADTCSKLFSDIVNVFISANSPDHIYVGRITRPMNVLKGNGEAFISTSQFGFPEDCLNDSIVSVPQMSSCVITKDGLSDITYPITGGKVTDYSSEEYQKIKEALRQKLKTEPTPMDYIGGGIFVTDRSRDKLRPNVKVIYDILWDLHLEGVLKTKIGTYEIPWVPGTSVKRIFFYI